MLFEKVCVWGPNPFNNKLFASQLYGLSHIAPACIDEDEEINKIFFDDTYIVFCDCDKRSISSYCSHLTRSSGAYGRSPSIALFNVDTNTDLIEDIINYPIRGVFYETDKFECITKGIDKVINGDYWISRDTLIQSLEIVRQQKNDKHPVSEPLLTKRETEILYLIVAGFSNQNIADKLFISSNTVKTHVSNLYKKIDVTNRVQAILWATGHKEL